MTRPTRNTLNRFALGCAALWVIFLVSCVATNRTMTAPPFIEGSTFIGTAQCMACHMEQAQYFDTATHARLVAETTNDKNIGCEACHGPGSSHLYSGGKAGTIVNPRRSPQTCLNCHLDKHAEFRLPNAHPVLGGEVACADCHDPHRGDAVVAGGTRTYWNESHTMQGRSNAAIGSGTHMATINDVCYRCHTAQRGPFVFEHEAIREGCTTCHAHHGSVNAKMLKARNHTLCLQCHYQEQTIDGRIRIGGRDHTIYVSRGTCWSVGCHEAIHGSHVDSTLRY